MIVVLISVQVSLVVMQINAQTKLLPDTSDPEVTKHFYAQLN